MTRRGLNVILHPINSVEYYITTMAKMISSFQRMLPGALLAWLLCCQPVFAGLQAPPLRGSLGAHDPSSIIKCKDKYYIFYTGQNISWKSSTDKIFWTEGGPVWWMRKNEIGRAHV